jgi:hypothetical protein
MLVRHGARMPSKKIMDAVRQLLPPVRDEIVAAHAAGKGTFCFLIWKRKLYFEVIKNQMC